jgi:hypothetical protein
LTDVWSKDPRRKQRGLASARGKVVGAAIILAAAGAATYQLWAPTARVDCETLVGRSTAAFEQADKDLKAASVTGTAARCSAYKARVAALKDLAALPAVCGPAPKRPGGWPTPNDERKWYETLIFEECR